MLVAKCFGQKSASAFHEISAYVVSFPFAFGTLCLINKLLNWGQTPPPLPPSAKAGTPPRVAEPTGQRPLVIAGTPSVTPTYDY